MKNKMRFCLAGCALLFSTASQADAVFTFTQANNNVYMTSSGTINLNNLVTASVEGWGGVGVEENGNTDIMGGTTVGYRIINSSFGFHAGTDYSEWLSANGPWSASNFNVSSVVGTKVFATYVRANGLQVPGLGINSADAINGLWSPDQNWTWLNKSFDSLQFHVGTYTVADAVTGESITFQVGEQSGEVPEPASIALAGLSLGALALSRRKKA